MDSLTDIVARVWTVLPIRVSVGLVYPTWDHVRLPLVDRDSRDTVSI